MATYPVIEPASDFGDSTGSGGGACATIIAHAPLTYDVISGDLNIAPCGAGSAGVVTTDAQTIAGAKVFTSVPSCAVVASASAHMVNKGYVDELMATGVHWIANINRFWDFASGDPTGLADGKRYIASTTSGDFTTNHIYTYDNATDTFADYTPTEGNACYVEDDDSATFANQCIIYNAAAWVSLGSSINHQSLIGAGTLTHATIDSYLNQAVKTTSSPLFTTVSASTGCECRPLVAVASRYDVGSYTQLGTPGGNIGMTFLRTLDTVATRWDTWIGRTSNRYTIGWNSPSLVEHFSIDTSGTVRAQTVVASTSATTGSLVVAGGAGFGGAIYGASTLSVPGDCGLTLLVDQISSMQAGTYAKFSSFSNPGVYFNRRMSGLDHKWELTQLPSDEICLYNRTSTLYSWISRSNGQFYISPNIASTSATTGSLVVVGGAGFGGRVFATNMSCATAPVAATDVVRKQELDAWAPTGALHIADTTDSTSVATGALIVDGGAGFAKSMFIGAELNMYSALLSSHTIRLGINARKTCQVRTIESDGLVMVFDIIDGPNVEDEYSPLILHKSFVNVTMATASTSTSSGSLVTAGGIGCQGAMHVAGRITAPDITCSTVPVADTDVIRKIDLDTWGDAIHITNTAATALTVVGGMQITGNSTLAGVVSCTADVASTTTGTGSLIVTGGAGFSGALNVGTTVTAGGVLTSSNIPAEYTLSGGNWSSAFPNVARLVYAQKMNNVITIYLKLDLDATTVAEGAAVYSVALPVGYRPQGNVVRSILIDNGASTLTTGILLVTTGGVIQITNSTNGNFADATVVKVYAFSISFSV